jgi:hypothetical protein
LSRLDQTKRSFSRAGVRVFACYPYCVSLLWMP